MEEINIFFNFIVRRLKIDNESPQGMVFTGEAPESDDGKFLVLDF